MGKVRQYFRLLAEDKIKDAGARFWNPILQGSSKIYGSASDFNRRLYEKNVYKRRTLPFPTISVGNVTWGGSGKTPLVEYLARLISEMNKTPVILTRGYSHDEVEQYREHLPKVLMGVGRDRFKTAQAIHAKNKVDVAILDDGFQHWPVNRDLEIVTVNALDPFGNEKLIPRGPLREPVTALERADVVVISHAKLAKPEALRALKRRIGEVSPSASVIEAYLEPLFCYKARKRQRIGLDKLGEQRVTTFSAVAAPRSFQIILANSNIKPVRNFEYTDHHMFSKRDLEEIKSVSEAAASDAIITTEKDFYRAPEQIAEILDPLVLATRLRISSGEEALIKKIEDVLGARR